MIYILILFTLSLIKVLYLLVHQFKDYISDKATITRQFIKIKNEVKRLMYFCGYTQNNANMFSFEFLLEIIFELFKNSLFVPGTHFLSIK